jgi:hypothetical protein
MVCEGRSIYEAITMIRYRIYSSLLGIFIGYLYTHTAIEWTSLAAACSNYMSGGGSSS